MPQFGGEKQLGKKLSDNTEVGRIAAVCKFVDACVLLFPKRWLFGESRVGYMAKSKTNRRKKDSLESSFNDLATKASLVQCDAYFSQVDTIVAPTELDTEIPILPRTLRDGYGDLFFVSGKEPDPEVTPEEKAKARALLKEIGVDVPDS